MLKDKYKNKQLIMDAVKVKLKSCAFTGHRNLEEDFSEKKLLKVVKALVKEGVETFYCGMAEGFDLYAAEAVLECKKKNPNIKLVACIPCARQSSGYQPMNKERYAAILPQADEKVQFTEGYFNGCMLLRNRYMIDHADIVVAYFKVPHGGTAYTVKYTTINYPLKEIIFL